MLTEGSDGLQIGKVKKQKKKNFCPENNSKCLRSPSASYVPPPPLQASVFVRTPNNIGLTWNDVYAFTV